MSVTEAHVRRAREIASAAHEGQVDKAGAPYFAHPARVAASLEDPAARCAAYLHDVVEDCPGWTLARLGAEGMPADVIAAVDALTKRAGEDNEAYLARVLANPLAVCVKIADLRDNMDLSRIAAPTAKDHARLEKYKRMLPRLEAALRS
jgi:GTP diphosphokinase / guanosine-3',5'-bis(diphosphate) 3'-diphosphatase